jgi:hypothetical protein
LRPDGQHLAAAGVVAYAEVVAVSHALSFADAYERGWFLVVMGSLRGSRFAIAVVRPPWPSFRLGATARRCRRPGRGRARTSSPSSFTSFALAVVTRRTTDGLTYHLMRGVL